MDRGMRDEGQVRPPLPVSLMPRHNNSLGARALLHLFYGVGKILSPYSR